MKFPHVRNSSFQVRRLSIYSYRLRHRRQNRQEIRLEDPATPQ
jgi:hypothetical protein